MCHASALEVVVEVVADAHPTSLSTIHLKPQGSGYLELKVQGPAICRHRQGQRVSKGAGDRIDEVSCTKEGESHKGCPVLSCQVKSSPNARYARTWNAMLYTIYTQIQIQTQTSKHLR